MSNEKILRGQQSVHPLYRTWSGIKSRCFKSYHEHYNKYGGRGITMCERWLVFENFVNDMGPKPSPLHSIDRIDNNGNYEPSNCRWATKSEQIQNRATGRYHFRGESLTLTEIAHRFGFSYKQIRSRVKFGLTLEQAVSTSYREFRSLKLKEKIDLNLDISA